LTGYKYPAIVTLDNRFNGYIGWPGNWPGIPLSEGNTVRISIIEELLYIGILIVIGVAYVHTIYSFAFAAPFG
jgi:hypothetical protein